MPTSAAFRSFSHSILRSRWLLALALTLLMALPSGATQVCADGCQFSTLQDAVDAAEEGQRILIDPGTYTENVLIEKSLTLVGGGRKPSGTVINGGLLDSVFRVRSPDPADPVVVELVNLTIKKGQAAEGGGIDSVGAVVTVRQCVVRNNRADLRGAGISAWDTELRVVQSTVRNNETAFGDLDSAGGGIFVGNGWAAITSSRLASNIAGGGGALSNRGGQVTLENSTVHGNLTFLGGAVESAEGGGLQVSFSTIGYNGTWHGHGGFCVDPVSSATLESSILVYDALIGPGMAPPCDGELISKGYNLVHAYPYWLIYVDRPEDLLNVHPAGVTGQKARLGGPTATLALEPGSPAIDAVPVDRCPALDQRGRVRLQDGDGDGAAACDIGAFEVGEALADPAGWEVSEWSHDRSEIDTTLHRPVAPGITPIRYSAIWDREREDLGYDPRFLPNTVSFDPDNRPVMRVGLHGELGEHATVVPASGKVSDGYLQTLAADGTWIQRSLPEILAQAVPGGWNDRIRSGTFQPEERVVFGADGDAYMVVRTTDGNYLLHSADGMASWTAYELDAAYDGLTMIEPGSATGAPIVLVGVRKVVDAAGVRHDKLWALFPEKNSAGTLEQPFDYLNPAPDLDVFLGPSHSGVGRKTATVGNETFVVFGSLEEVWNDDEGRYDTEQLIFSYDHDSKAVTGPTLLGATPCVYPGWCADVHNGPGIVADSKDMLHVVLGAHNTPFEYLFAPADLSEDWSEPEELAGSSGQETYVALVIYDDVLHLVSRMVDEAVYSLHSMRKKPDTPWEDLGKMVIPAPQHYGIWYHKLSVDRSGRLFLTYFYYSHNLSEEEAEAYLQKWPEDDLDGDGCIEAIPDTECSDAQREIRAHDPAILTSDDGGETWRLATTADFVDGWGG